MKELILSKWDEILSLLETEHGLSHIVINTWIKPLKLYSVEGKKLYFTIDEQMGARGIEFINKKMYDMFLVTSIREVLQDDSIEVVIDLESNLKTIQKKSSHLRNTTRQLQKAIFTQNIHLKHL